MRETQRGTVSNANAPPRLNRCRGTKRLATLLVLLSAVGVADDARAQSTNASLAVTLYDDLHHLLPGATASLRNPAVGQVRHATSNEAGTFYLIGLAPGTYELTIELAGFATQTNRNVILRIGEEAHLEITLHLLGRSESVQVTSGEMPMVNTQSSELGMTLSTKEIEDLPVPGRDFITLALLTPGILADQSTVSGGSGLVTAGQIGRDNAIALDGLSLIGTQSSTLRSGAPLDSVKEFTVLTNGFSAEYGPASGAVVNVLTRSGSNDLAARAFVYGRDDALDAVPAAARLVSPPLTKGKFEQTILGGFVGGPLVRDRAFVFGSLEYTDRDTEAIITSPSLPVFEPGEPSHVPQPYRHNQVLGRSDLHLNGSNTMTVRYRFDHSSLANRGVGGNVAQERGSDDVRTDEDFSVLDTQVIGSRSLNEVRAQRSGWYFGFDTTNYCYKCPTITRPDISLGGSGWSRRIEERWQVADSYSVLANGMGAHLLKAGIDLGLIDHDFDGLPNSDGSFHFQTSLPFDASDPLTYPDQYTRATGADSVHVAHKTYALFAADQWKLRTNLTLNLGARWDYDNGPGIARDRDNIAPRVGLAFSPSPDGRTVLRANYGVYYDAMYLALARMAAQSATAGTTTVVSNPGYPDPFGYNPVGAAARKPPAPSTQQLAADMETPYTQQATAGFDRVLPWRIAFSTDVVWARGRHLVYSKDQNYPDLDSPLSPKPRPDPTMQRVIAFETAGNSWYRGLQLAARTSQERRCAFSIAYTWSLAERDTEDFTFMAQDQRNWAADRGPSLSDVRHRFAASVNSRLPYGFQLAGVISARSALPYNVTTGLDNNGDSFLTDRPAGVSRNSERGDDFWQTDVRLARPFSLAHTRIEMLLEAFNVLNQSNWIAYNGNSAAKDGFKKPTSATDPRQLQMGVRLDF